MESKKKFVARYLIAILVAQIAAVLIGLTFHFVFTAHWFEVEVAQSIITCLQLWMWLCLMPVFKDESLWIYDRLHDEKGWFLIVITQIIVSLVIFACGIMLGQMIR